MKLDERGRPFTGKDAGLYYYRGRNWLGPTNAVGHSAGDPRFRLVYEIATDGHPIRVLGIEPNA